MVDPDVREAPHAIKHLKRTVGRMSLLIMLAFGLIILALLLILSDHQRILVLESQVRSAATTGVR